MSFQELLIAAMNVRDMRPSQLSELTGFPPSYFAKLKSGYVKDPTWERALVIINALDMTPAEFLALGNDGK